METVTLMINNTPVQVTKDKLLEYQQDGKYIVKMLSEGQYLLLEKMFG